MDLQLGDHTVLITGASGGIGRATAEAFAAEGAHLVLHTATREAELRTWLAGQSWSDRALVVAADVTRPAEVEAAFAAALVRFTRVDHCIANAGIWPPEYLRLDQLDEPRIRRTLEVNLFGAIWTARAFMSALSRTGARPDGTGATLTFVGSTAGRFGERGHAEYAASKSALRGLTLTLKNEIVDLDPYARVNLVDPGWTRTAMADEALTAPDVARVVRTMSLQQIARPQDIARALVLLASPAASRHISGEMLTIAGGMEGRLRWEPGEIDTARALRRLDD